MSGEGEGGARNPALDGLRALAVTAVLLFHGGVSWLPGGFLGVDLFFVLSGFLITGLLVVEHEATGRVSLLRFWSRRARRLLPALFIVVLAVVATAVFTADSGPPAGLRGDALATIGYVANWRLVLDGGGYFAQQADPSALQHTWSLAIEEQFYLLWPLIVVAALALARRRRWLVGVVAAVGAAASAGGTALASIRGADATGLYYRTDTRAQALLVGALLAVLLTRPGLDAPPRPGRWRGALWSGLAVLALGGTAVLWSESHGDQRWLYRGGLLLAALCAAGLVAVASQQPGSWFGRALSLWPLRTLGLISYGVYLWHWPVDLALTAERTNLHGPALLGARVVTTLALAVLSWFLVEQPIRRVARIPVLVVPVSVACAAATAFAVLALTVPVAPAAPAVAAVEEAPAPVASTTTPPASAPTPVASRPGTLKPSALTTTSAAVPRATQPVTPVHHGPLVPVTVLGDSVADSLGKGFAPVDEPQGTRVTNRGIVGCGVAATPRYRLRGQVYELADACRDWASTWAADIARDRPKVALVVLGRHEVWDGELNGHWTSVGHTDFDSYLAAQLDQAITVAAAGGALVAMTTSPYFHGREAPDGSRYPENDPARVDRFNQLLRAAVARHPGKAFVVDLGRRSCPDGHYTSTVDGIKIRSDGVHFTSAGARWLAPWLLPQLAARAG
ncbi:MAG: hypothetical protein QOJ92_2407 [Frankiales bacterium]|nr:hypothetical protein [Frankiales bacterium]